MRKRDLVDEVIAWPDIEAARLPVGSGTLISFQVDMEAFIMLCSLCAMLARLNALLLKNG